MLHGYTYFTNISVARHVTCSELNKLCLVDTQSFIGCAMFYFTDMFHDLSRDTRVCDFFILLYR